MSKKSLSLLIAAVVLSCAIAHAQARKDLDVYFIDVEGGQSTRFVSPSGQTMLIDAGWPGKRDADRVMAVAKVIVPIFLGVDQRACPPRSPPEPVLVPYD